MTVEPMPAERDVSCPHCGASRSTKAHRSTKISCYGCGELFPAPQPPAAPPEFPPAAASPAASGTNVVQLERATATTVKQRARPRARAAGGEDLELDDDDDQLQELEPDEVSTVVDHQELEQPVSAGGPGVDDPEDPPAPLAHLNPPTTERAKRSGRRGGRSRYQATVRRGRR